MVLVTAIRLIEEILRVQPQTLPLQTEADVQDGVQVENSHEEDHQVLQGDRKGVQVARSSRK